MPSFAFFSGSKQTRINQPQLTQISRMILLSLASAGFLAGCGADSPTTRTSDSTTTPTPEETYTLKVSSPVVLKNVVVTLIDTLSGKELGKNNITDGSDTTFTLKKADASSRELLITVSGQNAGSSYFDPVLGKFAPFAADKSLHAAFGMTTANAIATVNPFTEITYQRALVRANSITKVDNTLLTSDLVRLASLEVNGVFQVTPAQITRAVGSTDDLKKFIINPDGVEKPFNDTVEYLNTFYAIGHYVIQKNAQPNDATPYLTFAKRASDDMRDGSLDGLTLAGDGKNGTVYLENPIVSAPINTDLGKNTKAGVLETQESVQKNYADRLKSSILAFLDNDLKRPDATGYNYFNTVNYYTGMFTDPKYNVILPSLPYLHSLGAGNYKRAFGLDKVQLTTTSQNILKNTAQDCTIQPFVDPDADKANHTPQFVSPDCAIGINADGDKGDFNVVENLIGVYNAADSCKLTINFNGSVTLEKGTTRFTNNIGRKELDSLIRLTPLPANDQEKYVLNISSTSQTPVSLIQLRIENQEIVAATAGASSAKYPRQLDKPALTCTGFKPVFSKPF